jgi:GntR family transcriptional repressor for pyruvate dehydrogenase complex
MTRNSRWKLCNWIIRIVAMSNSISSTTAMMGGLALATRLHRAAIGDHIGGGSLAMKLSTAGRAIYHAVRDGKPEDAGEAMRRHLEGSRNRLFEGRLLDLSR